MGNAKEAVKEEEGDDEDGAWEKWVAEVTNVDEGEGFTTVVSGNVGSFSRHKIEAKRCGIGLRSVSRCSLSFDVDLPRDFSQLCVYETDHGVVRLTRGLGVISPS